MKSFGEVIREARLERGVTLSELAKTTKIRVQFLRALESQKWDKLPEYPVVQGFVRLIGHSLEADESKLVAFLRRDYPPKQLRVTPKPDVVSKKVKWSAKVPIFVGALFVLLVVIGYLFYQYQSFVSPPRLSVDVPQDGYTATEPSVEVRGSTTQDATVNVNNQPFIVGSEGDFSGKIGITKDTSEIEVKAISRAGKETVVKRSIVTDF